MFTDSGQNPEEGFCEHYNEHPDSMIAENKRSQLRNCEGLKVRL